MAPSLLLQWPNASRATEPGPCRAPLEPGPRGREVGAVLRGLVCLRTGRQAAGRALRGSACGRGAERAVDSSCRTCGSGSCAGPSGQKENPLAEPEAAISSAWAVWKALEGSREGRSAAARHPCPVPSSCSHGLCAEMPAQLLTGPGGAAGRGCWPGCGPTAHHGEAGRWPCAGHSLTSSPWSRRGGRRMETHGHKSGVCFYWCFYFRFSVWKRTFHAFQATSVRMINANVYKRKEGKSVPGPGSSPW